MAVVADRVADHDQPRRGQAVDRRPDRRGDAAGLVDDDEQVAGMLPAEAFLVLRREAEGAPVGAHLHGEALGRGVALGEMVRAEVEPGADAASLLEPGPSARRISFQSTETTWRWSGPVVITRLIGRVYSHQSTVPASKKLLPTARPAGTTVTGLRAMASQTATCFDQSRRPSTSS